MDLIYNTHLMLDALSKALAILYIQSVSLFINQQYILI